mmetsp:Transcript_59186/g.170001  ORF Transcript_59186/g.170001 Transcript_59186/m.170001 type:complete len:277 (+) Transcript_59186:719-1549(+)
MCQNGDVRGLVLQKREADAAQLRRLCTRLQVRARHAHREARGRQHHGPGPGVDPAARVQRPGEGRSKRRQRHRLGWDQHLHEPVVDGVARVVALAGQDGVRVVRAGAHVQVPGGLGVAAGHELERRAANFSRRHGVLGLNEFVAVDLVMSPDHCVCARLHGLVIPPLVRALLLALVHLDVLTPRGSCEGERDVRGDIAIHVAVECGHGEGLQRRLFDGASEEREDVLSLPSIALHPHGLLCCLEHDFVLANEAFLVPHEEKQDQREGQQAHTTHQA